MCMVLQTFKPTLTFEVVYNNLKQMFNNVELFKESPEKDTNVLNPEHCFKTLEDFYILCDNQIHGLMRISKHQDKFIAIEFDSSYLWKLFIEKIGNEYNYTA